MWKIKHTWEYSLILFTRRSDTSLFGYVTSVKSWFQSICSFFTHTSSSIAPHRKTLHRDLLLFLFQPTRTHYSFQDLVQNAIAFQALFSTYLPVTLSRWHSCAPFQQEPPSPQLPPSLALYIFKFQIKFHLPSTYNFNYLTGLLNSAAFLQMKKLHKECRQKW